MTTIKIKELKNQYQSIRTAPDLAAWAAAMYASGLLNESEMLPTTNLQPWDAPDTWEQSEDNGEDFTITAPDGSSARWSNSERAWIVV